MANQEYEPSTAVSFCIANPTFAINAFIRQGFGRRGELFGVVNWGGGLKSDTGQRVAAMGRAANGGINRQNGRKPGEVAKKSVIGAASVGGPVACGEKRVAKKLVGHVCTDR